MPHPLFLWLRKLRFLEVENWTWFHQKLSKNCASCFVLPVLGKNTRLPCWLPRMLCCMILKERDSFLFSMFQFWVNEFLFWHQCFVSALHPSSDPVYASLFSYGWFLCIGFLVTCRWTWWCSCKWNTTTPRIQSISTSVNNEFDTTNPRFVYICTLYGLNADRWG